MRKPHTIRAITWGVVATALAIFTLVIVLTGCTPRKTPSCPCTTACEPAWETPVQDDHPRGSLRGDVSAASHRVSAAAKESENAARWAAICLARFHRDGLEIRFGERRRFPILIKFPDDEAPK